MFFAAVLVAQVGLGIDRSLPSATFKPVSCANAADPAIESVTAEKTDGQHGSDTFTIHASVLNRGKLPQRPTVRQIVSVYQIDDRIATVSIPALGAGEAFAFTTYFKRSSDAGSDSTTLSLRFGGINFAPNSLADCNERNDSFRLTF